MYRASMADNLDDNTSQKTPQKPPRYAQNHPLSRFLKAMLDYVIVVPGLILIAPLLVTLTILVKMDSPGPVLHRRRVLGRNGRVFYAYKFRTMFVNGDEILTQYPQLKEELAQNYKLKCDPRVTRVGAMLRKFSLDELPQLLNVLKQEMSLIGPRIITPDEISKYGDNRDALLATMPGLTGLWQVSGRSDVSYNERVTLDMEYIHNWSVFLDIKIILLTIPAVLKGDGAY